MERACRQLPRSYKLWKMVSFRAYTITLRGAMIDQLINTFNSTLSFEHGILRAETLPFTAQSSKKSMVCSNEL